MKKRLLVLVGSVLLSTNVFGQTKGLIISEFFTNPSGNDSPFEYVELLATIPINFASTPYAVVFTDNGTATSNGWKAGSSVSYGFTISSGSVVAGQVVYVGGSSMLPLSNGGVALKTKNTGSSSGDSFGSSNSAGVLGQGGSNADGIAVFSVSASSISSSTVPVDAIFFGTSVGSAYNSSSSGYQMPVNDKYNGGKLSTGIFLAPDPASGDLVKATSGVYNPTTNVFTTVRAWAASTTATYNTTSITLTTGGGGGTNVAPTLSFNTTASKLVDLTSAKVSCVMNNTTDPVIVLGLDITVGDEDLTSLTFSMTSSNTSVVPNANFTIVGTGTSRKFIINPIAVGYATITLKVTDNGGLTKTISLSLAVSDSIATNTVSTDVYHTGSADGSTAIPVDANYMFVADDENNIIRLYNRNTSGLPVYSFDAGSYLATTGTEVDIEGSFRSPTNPNRIYWIGSLSNNKNGESRPDRDRIFATDIVGSGASATLTFVGYYKGLRAKLISWGDSKGYNFTAKAATGIEPKRIDGFNVEGLEMGPDGTTLYIAFRAPYVGTATNKAVIAPLLNFESWFGTGSPSSSPTFGNSIELDLNNHGIRSLGKNASNQFLIVAGSYAADGTFALYQWNGLSTSAPVALSTNLIGLSPEGIVDVPATLSGSFQVQLLSDLGGSFIPYNDGIVDKDLTEPNYQKGLSSLVTVSGGSRTAASFDSEQATAVESYTIYPNPTSGVLTIEVSAGKEETFLVYDAAGSLVREIHSSEANVMVDLTQLNRGFYVIKREGTNQTVKVSKQ
ncbi:MAG: T9SS type A sorting domain-containing protein [Cytophagaceae bacterium]|nr:T9SS type A sorting domain-containing protein [Cytophagaceae bacterium]